jgi:pyruvate,water dikinase
MERWFSANGRNNKKYAVRSSALCEDGKTNSFAGIFETYLNVGPEEVLEAAHKCQASALSARAAAYCSMRSADLAHMAVVVQEMVIPRCAGVCFTANPVDGDLTKVVIEAVPGLGERLVSGIETPEYWLVGEDNSIEMYEVGQALSDQVLQLFEVLRLASEGRRLARCFGYPLDIEFAFADSKLYFLQARPITGLISAA